MRPTAVILLSGILLCLAAPPVDALQPGKPLKRMRRWGFSWRPWRGQSNTAQQNQEEQSENLIEQSSSQVEVLGQRTVDHGTEHQVEEDVLGQSAYQLEDAGQQPSEAESLAEHNMFSQSANQLEDFELQPSESEPLAEKNMFSQSAHQVEAQQPSGNMRGQNAYQVEVIGQESSGDYVQLNNFDRNDYTQQSASSDDFLSQNQANIESDRDHRDFQHESLQNEDINLVAHSPEPTDSESLPDASVEQKPSFWRRYNPFRRSNSETRDNNEPAAEENVEEITDASSPESSPDASVERKPSFWRRYNPFRRSNSDARDNEEPIAEEDVIQVDRSFNTLQVPYHEELDSSLEHQNTKEVSRDDERSFWSRYNPMRGISNVMRGSVNRMRSFGHRAHNASHRGWNAIRRATNATGRGIVTVGKKIGRAIRTGYRKAKRKLSGRERFRSFVDRVRDGVESGNQATINMLERFGIHVSQNEDGISQTSVKEEFIPVEQILQTQGMLSQDTTLDRLREDDFEIKIIYVDLEEEKDEEENFPDAEEGDESGEASVEDENTVPNSKIPVNNVSTTRPTPPPRPSTTTKRTTTTTTSKTTAKTTTTTTTTTTPPPPPLPLTTKSPFENITNSAASSDRVTTITTKKPATIAGGGSSEDDSNDDFPDLFADNSVRDRLADIYSKGDFSHAEMDLGFEFDPDSDYCYYYDIE